MEKRIWEKPSFCVVGKEGSTADGAGFVQRLWQEANSCFAEVQSLAVTDENGVPVGVWGAMSDMGRNFLPWEEDFTKGLYLAGVEARKDAQPPAGWVKWMIPGFSYLCVSAEEEDAFAMGLEYLREQEETLVGAVQEFTNPATGESWMCFPIAILPNGDESDA